MKIAIQLVNSAVGDYAGHRVSIGYAVRIPSLQEGDAQSLNVVSSAPVAPDGLATVDLDSDQDVDIEAGFELQVRAPDGEILLDAVPLPAEVVNAADPYEVEAEPKAYFNVGHSDNPSFGKPSRVRGRVIDIESGHEVARATVVLRAIEEDAEGQEPIIVANAQTDSSGYFFAPYPSGSFAAADGIVGGKTHAPIPIRLEDDGAFPQQMILGVSDTGGKGDDEDDCSCNSPVPRAPESDDLVNSPEAYSADLGTGHCVDLTKPNRVLEEFNFHTVVRTTEPRLRGVSLQPPPKVSLGSILSILDTKVYKAATRAASAPAAEAVGEDFDHTRFAFAGRVIADDAPEEGAEMRAASAVATALPELHDLTEAVSLQALRLQATPSRLESDEDQETESASIQLAPLEGLAETKIDADIARTLAVDPDGFSLTKLATAELLTRKRDLKRLLTLMFRVRPDRGPLDCLHKVDWDHEPTIYQACTIAHGHILTMKQQWVADGYSLGDLLYSLPLAPCQKKQIAIVDWDRSEAARRTEYLEAREELQAQLSRDRDISEIVNGSLNESVKGGSEAETDSYSAGLGHGGGIGLSLGGMLSFGAGLSGGVSFGGGSGSSTAWQESSRQVSADSLQQLRDRTMQSASAVRSQRSTVVQNMRQGETVTAQTEVVANHNHCHAITIEYFEVLRHFLIRNQLATVQECLLVPLMMSRFDSAKALRWRGTLSRYVRPRRLRRGFGALQRVRDHWVGSGMPVGAYADGTLEHLEGYLYLRIHIRRPADTANGAFLADSWLGVETLTGIGASGWFEDHLEAREERDRIFRERLGQQLAEEVVRSLRVVAELEGGGSRELPIDASLVTEFKDGQELYVSLRLNGALPGLVRKSIRGIRVASGEVGKGAQAIPATEALPTGSRVIVTSGRMDYRTRHLSHALFNNGRILNDLAAGDPVVIATPLSRRELRRPREEDKRFANDLLAHLNDRIEFYHRAIWWNMDAQRRFMLLDGFVAPNSGGRSVASVVENRLVGIVGNCLVMPVVPGLHLDPTYRQDDEDPIDLFEHYQPTTTPAPMRVSLPTRGVFAESIMGACNSCERKDESRFWRWEESPCPGEPTPILPVDTSSRRSEAPNLEAKDFPSPIIAMQNAPSAPDPSGVSAALQVLSTPGIFGDLSGLTQNQRNAIAALQRAYASTETFAALAAEMSGRADGAVGLVRQQQMGRDMDKFLNKVQESVDKKIILPETGARLAKTFLESVAGGPSADPLSTDDVEDITETAGKNDASVSLRRPSGEQIDVDASDGKLEDTPNPVIDLSPEGREGATRAFFPNASVGRSGVITLKAIVKNAPVGATVQWHTVDNDAIDTESTSSIQTRIFAKRPGTTELTFALKDDGDQQLGSFVIPLSVPQFVLIDEDASEFEQALSDLQMDDVKSALLDVAKETCDRLLLTSNVRTIWAVNLGESLPPHVPTNRITEVTIKNETGPKSPYGEALQPAGPTVFNETINVYPGAYDNASPSDVSAATQTAVSKLASQNFTDPHLKQLAIDVFGRLLGETMAHEIVHSLLAFLIPTGHNDPAIPNDLMNSGIDRNFLQRTGIEIGDIANFPDPGTFVDHGIGAIGTLHAANQSRIDSVFPVVPDAIRILVSP